MRLQICTFKWGAKYTPEHVIRLRNMLERNLTIDYDFVLITDQPQRDSEATGVQCIQLWDDMRDAKLCGVRLKAFSDEMKYVIGSRFAWIDLDVVIVNNVDHIFGRTEPFIAAAPAGPPMLYNGSLVMMDAGARSHVYENWNMEDYHRLGREWGKSVGLEAGTVSDEGWMSVQMPGPEARFTKKDGIYYFRRDLARGAKPLPDNASIVVMNGRAFDPALARWRSRCSWISKHWR